MKVVITAVGQRTEHWTDLFEVLAERSELEITVVVSDVSNLTIDGLARCEKRDPSFRFHHVRHVLSESHTGHMASIVLRPGSLDRLGIDRPDVIHMIGEPSYLSAAQIVRWRQRRFPTVPLTHYAAQNVVMRLPPPFPQIERRTYRAVDQMFPITPAAQRVLRTKGYRGASTIIPLGVDTELFTPSAPSPFDEPEGESSAGTPATDRSFTIGFVGRLEAHKGIAELLAAAESIDSDVLLVGAGSLEPLVVAAAERRPDRVVLEPWCDHDRLPDLLRQMDVLVLPSIETVQRNVLPWIGIPLREQFGRVLVEAMACGVPVVGSAVGEIAHVIGDAGLVYPAGDEPALARALRTLRDDRALASRLGRAGIDRAASEFSWARVADQLCAEWDGLAADGHRETNDASFEDRQVIEG